jgi:hypothetical protein
LDEVIAAADPELQPYSRLSAPNPGDPHEDFVLAAVHEGYLLHYAEPRAFQIEDEDLRLLAGDILYALGLARLAAEGDLPAVAKLADLITGCARAQAEGDPDAAGDLWTSASR